MHSERARQWVHIGSGSFALLLRVLTWWQAAALAACALAFNVVALPRVGGRRLYRPADEARGFPIGIVLYRSEEHTSELQSLRHLVCRLLLAKKKAQRR